MGKGSQSIVIISGGQTGADRATLDAALAAGVACGGWCPENRLAEDGPLDQRYPLKPLLEGGYRERTRRNVQDSDGTVVLCFGVPEGGSGVTLRDCQELGKPHLVIDAASWTVEQAASAMAEFVLRHQISRLNVAGPRASEQPGIYAYIRQVMSLFLQQSGKPLSPRQRVLAALEHRQPDRTPRDFWAEPPTWKRLLAHAGHSDKDRLLDELGIDVRHLEIPSPAEKQISDGVYQNFWGERYIYRQTPWGALREDIRGALADARSLTDLERFDWPSPEQFDYAALAEQCSRWDDYALLYGFADVWQRPALVRGWEGMFLDLAERPEWVHFLCRRFTDFYKEDYRRAAEATRGRIDLYLLISDLGSQNGPLISLAMFREFVAPYLKEMIDCIHSLGAKVLYHSCGSIRPFIPELIELGVDVLDPIQPTGPAMTPEQLKQDFGEQLCFHGGIDMQHLLPHGTPQQVRAEASRYCQMLGRRGGYILAPAHLFQPDVPPENILAMYQGEEGV